MLLAPSEVLDCGLEIFRLTKRAKRWNLDRQELEFHKHFGSASSVIAAIWSDLLLFSDLKKKEKGGKGFKQYMVTMHFLWARPKNASADSLFGNVWREYRKLEGYQDRSQTCR